MAFKPYLVVDRKPDVVDDPEESLRRFRRHLVVYKGLAASSVDNCIRVTRKILRELGSAHPAHEQIEAFIERIRTGAYSWSYVGNLSLSIERYMEFIDDPIKLGRPRKPKRVVKTTLSEAEVAILIDAGRDTRERALLALLAYSAVRNQELCDLRVRSVDIANGEVLVESGKGDKDRVCYITGECARVVAEYVAEHHLADDDHLFVTTRGKRPMRPHVVRRLLTRVVRRTRIRKHVHPHILRHSWATNMLNKGANPRTVQAQLGHEHIETTMIYVQSRPKRVKAEIQLYALSYV